MWVCFTDVLFLHITCVLTKKRFKSGLIISYILSTILFLMCWYSTLILKGPGPLFDGKFYVSSPGILFPAWYIKWFITLAYAFYVLARYTVTMKEPLNYYFLIPSLFSFLIGMLNYLVPYKVAIFQYGNFGIALYSALATYFIFSKQIIGIKIVLEKGLFYSIFIAILTGLYLLLIVILENIFRSIVGYKSFILSLSSAFFMALLFNPLRNKIQLFVEHTLLGKTPQEIAHENELLRQELERSDRLKAASTLALGLAHEVKNPLTTIQTFAEYLPEKYNDAEFVKKFAKIIPIEVGRINNIVSQLLRFSKPLPPEFKSVNICRLIREILDLETSEFLRRRIACKERCDADNPTVDADSAQLKQAFFNIILNAIDAMPNGGILDIGISQTNDGYLTIELRDQGGGIPQEDLKRIFDPFFTTKDSGTGLGLSISHQIIKNHNGRIEVSSRINEGTTFTIKLPQKL
jgi:signal transduction histidine kinase